MVISFYLFALMKLLSCLQVQKKYEKKQNIRFFSLASNFWPVTNIRKTWTWEFVLLLNSWNLNLKSRRVHLPCSWQKKPVYRPLEEKWRTKRLSCLLSHRKQKEVTEKAKGKKKQQSDLKGKGERMNAEAWRSVLAAQKKFCHKKSWETRKDNKRTFSRCPKRR